MATSPHGADRAHRPPRHWQRAHPASWRRERSLPSHRPARLQELAPSHPRPEASAPTSVLAVRRWSLSHRPARRPLRLRRIARAGGDPLAERRQARIAPSRPFRKRPRRVHEAHSPTFRNPKHRQQWLSSLTPIFAAIGKKPVDAVTSADLLATLGSFWLTRQETARRVLQRIRVIFDWCKAQGFCTGDLPTHGLTKAPA